MALKLITLCENTASMRPGILAEHGLSIYLESKETRLIFDTGQTSTAAHNSELLGLDLKGVEIALSHGHYDHTGGLESILKLSGPTQIFCHPDAFSPKYSQRSEGLVYSGMPRRRENYEAMGANFHLSREPRRLAEGVWLTGEIPRKTRFEQAERDLLILDPEKRVDPMLDDQALVVEMDQDLLVVLGCAHSGMINTIEYACEITGKNQVFGVVGGTHLGFGNKADPERLGMTVEALKSHDLRLLGASHCTGIIVAARLAKEFEDAFLLNNAGTAIEL